MRFENDMATIDLSPSQAGEILAIESRLTAALKKAARDVLIQHKRSGEPVVSWKDGHVVLIPPEQIVIPPAED